MAQARPGRSTWRRASQKAMFRHVLIDDEITVTNAVQIEIVESIAAAGSGNLTAVGDDAQSIYRNQALPITTTSSKFPDRHAGCQIFQLGLNYRSIPEIVALTKASICTKPNRFLQNSANQRGQRRASAGCRDQRRLRRPRPHLPANCSEARPQDRAFGEITVLYRNHHDSILLQGELPHRGIPYTIHPAACVFLNRHISKMCWRIYALCKTRVMKHPGAGFYSCCRVSAA